MLEEYDIVVVGGGISGTALLYTLSNFTDIESIALIEKETELGEINSHHTMNSQTLHFGDIETNYSLEKAEEVKEGAEMVAGYLENKDSDKEMYSKRSKMVLAVGEKEVEKLEKRHREEGFGELFPKLEMIEKERIKDIEPAVVEGRDSEKKMNALYTPDGYTVDYGKTTKSFAEEAENSSTQIFLDEKVKNVEENEDGFTVSTSEKEIKSDVVVVSAGPQTLKFAKEMGYGEHMSLLPIAGSFFTTNNGYLNGKVYTLQMKGLPFAAVHGDADVHKPGTTRFGPTAKLVPTLERGKLSTILGFLDSFNLDLNGLLSYITVLWDRTLFSYVMKNLVYDIPIIGRAAFLPDVKKVVPEAGFSDIKRAKGYGGVRPQIIDTDKRSLDLGEARIEGENILFNITPSPGASNCLKNAFKNTKKIMDYFDEEYSFEKKNFRNETIDKFPRK